MSRLLALLLFGALGAAQAAAPADFRDWLGTLRQEALAQGISAQTFEAAFAGIEPIERVIELDRQQPEFTQTFWSYLDARVTEWRIARGRSLLRTHRKLLGQIEARYGVPPRYLVAFWGLETNFGNHLGGFPVIGSLATLAFDARRAAFFRAELLDALRILEGGHIAPAQMQGSWAGAMGHLQFMPSTFARYAVDADGDGRKDIWASLPDTFASGANYLSGVGWQRDQAWGREVRLPEGFDWTLADPAVKRPVRDWAALGVRRADGQALPDSELSGAIVLPQGHRGPAFLVYANFEAILHWNRSVNYAVAVGHLADRLIERPALRNGREADNRPLSRDDALELQTLLNRLGFDAGTPDGIPGPQTRKAVRAYQQSAGLPGDGHPSVGLLEALRRAQHP